MSFSKFVFSKSLKASALLRPLALVLVASLSVSGGALAESQYVEVAEVFNSLTLSFGTPPPSVPLSGPELTLYVWNIHKAKDKNLPQDFQATSLGTDIALFQEAVNYTAFTQALTASNPLLGWTMAKSFNVTEETYTGVATGSRVKPLKEEVIVSEATEPITGTHKTILLSQFLVQWQAEPLLVANIHAINFVTLGVFKTQIKQLLARVREHKGPLIVAGDFNTWNNNRMNYLKTAFAPLGLTLVDAPNDRFLNLDHVFVRGLKVQTVNRFSHIRSSDHTPLKVNFVFDNSPLESHENTH